MLQARQARKKAEEDVKLLENRLKNLKVRNCLHVNLKYSIVGALIIFKLQLNVCPSQLEEEKALSRVKNIQGRAAEVANLKQSNQENRQYLNSRRASRLVLM